MLTGTRQAGASPNFSPGSEWRLHRLWFDQSALADLLDGDLRLVAKHALYACHDLLPAHNAGLFSHLKERWSSLFRSGFDVLLDDLTGSYFGVDANGEHRAGSGMSRVRALRPRSSPRRFQ